MAAPTPTRGGLRVARGCAVALSSAALAVAAHAVGDGRLPDAGLAVVLTVLLAGVSTALADRRRGPLAILALAGSGQLGMHVLLAALAGHPHGGGAMTEAPGAAHPVAMTVTHAGATLLVAALLAGAERATFAAATALAAVLPRRIDPLPIEAPLRLAPPTGLPVRPLAEELRKPVHRRRGPPVLV